MRKYAPNMKEKAFLSILNKKFPRGACPRTPLAAWALRAQVTRPKGMYIRVTPVTTKATAVQNSTENPGDIGSLIFFKCLKGYIYFNVLSNVKL